MPLLMVHDGGLAFLADALANGEDWELALYTSAVSGSESSVAGDFTAAEATFTGYSRKPLVRNVGSGNWSAPTLAAPSSAWSARSQVATSTYAVQAWTNGSGSPVAVYGYFLVGATSGDLVLFEQFGSARTLESGDSIEVTAQVQLA